MFRYPRFIKTAEAFGDLHFKNQNQINYSSKNFA